MLSVVKLGGSVLTGVAAYRRAAAMIAQRLAKNPGEKLLVIVSAEAGTTDALELLAAELSSNPDPATLDLLWSTGEIRSVALLTLALQSRGVRATGVNVHQTGLVVRDGGPDSAELRPLRLRALLAGHDVAVVPGFLARGDGDAVADLAQFPELAIAPVQDSAQQRYERTQPDQDSDQHVVIGTRHVLRPGGASDPMFSVPVQRAIAGRARRRLLLFRFAVEA
jgi:hypothetical protein